MNNLSLIITEEQAKMLINGALNEIAKKSIERINTAMDNAARRAFGDDYRKENTFMTDKFFRNVGDNSRTITNTLDIASGMFSLGNQKLSKNTLILNFTSALGCPSFDKCPISQLACYASTGESRFPDSRRKNIMVQQYIRRAMSSGTLEDYFNIARLYVEEMSNKKNPIRFIRYNEVGDFPNDEVLAMAARFSDEMREKYGILSMAYTARGGKNGIHPDAIVNGKPIDQIIKINRSRNDIPASEGSIQQQFYGIPITRAAFSTDPVENLKNSYSDVCEVTTEQANKLKVVAPMKDEHGLPSIPVLVKGNWDGGSGYYYVCPCSFWRYNKTIATEKFMRNQGVLGENEYLPDNASGIGKLYAQLTPEAMKALKKILNKIKSPCGVQCAVCHDMQGGIDAETGENGIKNYTVITATHGVGASNYNQEYANAKRNGNDDVSYSEDNKYGRITKYDKKQDS